MLDDTNTKSSSKFPEIILVVAGNQTIKQDYKNLTIIQEHNPTNIINFFNDNIVQNKYQMFLEPNINFITGSSILSMINPMIKYEEFKGVYSDVDNYYFPSYNYNYFNLEESSILFNIPILCRNMGDMKFKNIELYYHAFISNFAQKYFLYHLPKPLIRLKNKNILSEHINELIQCLKQ